MSSASATIADDSSIPLASVAASVLGLNNFLSPFIFCPYFGCSFCLGWLPASHFNAGFGAET